MNKQAQSRNDTPEEQTKSLEQVLNELTDALIDIYYEDPTRFAFYYNEICQDKVRWHDVQRGFIYVRRAELEVTEGLVEDIREGSPFLADVREDEAIIDEEVEFDDGRHMEIQLVANGPGGSCWVRCAFLDDWGNCRDWRDMGASFVGKHVMLDDSEDTEYVIDVKIASRPKGTQSGH